MRFIGVLSGIIILFTSCTPPKSIKPLTFGGEKYDSARSIIKTKDGYVLAGMTVSFGVGHVNVYWLKISKWGKFIKQNTFGGKDDDRGFAVIEAPDNGFFIAGYTTSYGAGNNDIYLVRTDKDGNYKDSKVFGGPRMDSASAICAADKGGYMIAGQSNSFSKGDYDAYIIRTDADGNCVWAKTYGGEGQDMAYTITAAGNDRYIAAGESNSFSKKFPEMYVFMIDGKGNLIWSKTFGGGTYGRANSIVKTSGNDFIIAGERGSKDTSSDIDLLRIDSMGNTEWEKTYGGPQADTPAQIIESKDGGFLIVGTTESGGNGMSDILMLKTDNNGELKWQRFYGGRQEDYAGGVVQDKDGGYVVAGWTHSFGAGDFDVYFFKTDSNGDIK